MNRPPTTFNEVPECVSQTLDELRDLKKFLLAYIATSSSNKGVEVDELLTPEQTAELLKVSKVTVWQWSKPKPGLLTPRRIGNQVRYLRSEVMAAVRPLKEGKGA